MELLFLKIKSFILCLLPYYDKMIMHLDLAIVSIQSRTNYMCLIFIWYFFNINDRMFHAFLLDEANKVMGIGNPVGNPKIKELYLDMIQRKKVDKPMRQPQTEVGIICSLIDMGTFDWKQEQMTHFTLKNTGNNPLVIIDVATSCGCTSVEYPKEPMHSGRSVELKVRYKADHPEHFNKTISVYCNAASSPIKLAVKGRAE